MDVTKADLERGPAGDAEVSLRPLCRRLRFKAMYMDRVADPDLPPIDDGFVWCTHTMNCLGPDGVVASKKACRRGRACYEEKS